jgi:hypothetical protein
MLSSGMITPPILIFPENFTHSAPTHTKYLQCEQYPDTDALYVEGPELKTSWIQIYDFKKYGFQSYVTVKEFKTSGPITKQNMCQNTSTFVVIFSFFNNLIKLVQSLITKDFSV